MNPHETTMSSFIPSFPTKGQPIRVPKKKHSAHLANLVSLGIELLHRFFVLFSVRGQLTPCETLASYGMAVQRIIKVLTQTMNVFCEMSFKKNIRVFCILFNIPPKKYMSITV